MAVINGTSASGNVLAGSPAADSITGLGGPDTIIGGGGQDTINAGGGNDTITFGISGDASSALVFGNAGGDSITNGGFSLSGNNTIVGGDDSTDGADTINVSTDLGRDLLLGNGGDDLIFAGLNASTIAGGFGNDNIQIGATHGEFVFGNQGDDTIISTAASSVGGGDSIIGGQGNDLIEMDSLSTGTILFGAEGADTVTVGGGNGATIIGGIDSADGADFVSIRGGSNDLIFGNGGNDTVNIGPGAVGAVTGSQTIVGGFGDDTIINSATTATNDLILGNEGNDTINDAIAFTGGGTESLLGGLGTDTILAGVGNANDIIIGGEGSDSISLGGGTGAVTIWGGTDTAGGAADAANNIDTSLHLTGAGSIFAGSANDQITLGAKTTADTVTGGAGNDTVSVTVNPGSAASNAGTAVTPTTPPAAGLIDTITDFVSGTDVIRNGVQNAVTVNNAGDLSAQTNLATAASLALAGSNVKGSAAIFKYGADFFVTENLSTAVGYDAGTDLLIDVKNTSAITAADLKA